MMLISLAKVLDKRSRVVDDLVSVRNSKLVKAEHLQTGELHEYRTL